MGSDSHSAQGLPVDTQGNVKVNVVAGGAGGGAVTVADGADVTQGSTADSAWVSGAGTVISLLKKIASGGGGSAVSIADGSDAAEGTTTDAAVTTDIAGTVSGKLRGLVKILSSVWDSVHSFLKTSLVDASGVAVGTVTNPITAVPNVLTSATATLNGVNVSVGVAVPVGGRWLAFRSTPGSTNSLVGSVALEFSIDGGGSYNAGNSSQTRQYTVFSSGGTRGTFATPLFDGSNMQVEVLAGPLDRNVTHVRYNVTSYTSGSFAATLDCFAEEPNFIRYAMASSQNAPSGSQYGNASGGAIVVGGSDGGGTTFPLPITNGGSVSQFDPLVKVAVGNVASAAAIGVRDSSGNKVDGATSAPAGTERGLITRNIPSGTQPVSIASTVTTSDAHLPAAVALSDALPNPTTTEIGANLLGWDPSGGVWRRIPVDGIGGSNTGAMWVEVIGPVNFNESALAGAGANVLINPDDVSASPSGSGIASLYLCEIILGSATTADVIIEENTEAFGIFSYEPVPVENLTSRISVPSGEVKLTQTTQTYVKLAVGNRSSLGGGFRVRLVASDGTVAVAWSAYKAGGTVLLNGLPAGSNLIGKVDASGTVLSTTLVGQTNEHLSNIVRELRVITYYLKSGLGVFDEPNEVRQTVDLDDAHFSG